MLGGSNDPGNMVTMSVVRHRELHTLMRKYMQQIFSIYSRRSMDMVRGRGGKAVLKDFGMDFIRQAVDQFYRDNVDKFPDC